MAPPGPACGVSWAPGGVEQHRRSLPTQARSSLTPVRSVSKHSTCCPRADPSDRGTHFPAKPRRVAGTVAACFQKHLPMWCVLAC